MIRRTVGRLMRAMGCGEGRRGLGHDHLGCPQGMCLADFGATALDANRNSRVWLADMTLLDPHAAQVACA